MVEYIHWLVADNNKEDVTHVKIENIIFINKVVFYTKGLVTLYGCTIHDWTRFLIYTSVHNVLQMFLLSGIRTVNIINSDFGKYDNLHFVAGNDCVNTVNLHHVTVFNISIINTTFTNCQTRYWAYGRDSIISMNTTHSTFNNSLIYQTEGDGYFGAVIEDIKSHKSTVLFPKVISVSMRNCDYEVSDTMLFDNVNIGGNDYFNDYHDTFKLLFCLPSHCEDANCLY